MTTLNHDKAPMCRTVLCASLAIVLLSIFIAPKAFAASSFVNNSDAQGNATLSEPTANDAFVSGNSVRVAAPVGGELFAGGNVVTIEKLTGRSIYIAGNVVTVDQGSGYNAFAVGNTVTLSGEYGHDVYVAGTTVIVKEGTVINGDLRIAGSVVTIAGTVKGNVYVSAGQVTSATIVGGNFSGKEDSIAFLNGSIGGNLEYQSAKAATGLTHVSVAGKTTRTDPPKPTPAPVYSHVLGWVLELVSTLILAVVLILLIPKIVVRKTEEVWSDWSKNAAIGGVSLVVIPLVLAIAFATIIGWKVGLFLLGVYGIGLLISYTLATIALGQLLLRRFTGRQSPWLSLLAGLICISLVSAIPWLGWLASLSFFVAFVVPAFGVLVLGLRNSDRP